MSAPITVCTVQFTPIFGDKNGNRERMSALIRDVEADIIIFPELATTGYCFVNAEEAQQYAEYADGATFQYFHTLAQEKQSVIICGFAEMIADKSGTIQTYNSAMIIQPTPITIPLVYRKTHLFYKEKYCFTAGNTGFFVVQHALKDVRIGTMICYDWRFPEAARTLALMGADFIACPSNLITEVWVRTMPARAVENGVYLSVANRAGAEDRIGEVVSFNGQSAMYDTLGKTIAHANATDDAILLATVDIQKARNKAFNSENHLFHDRRPSMYEL